MFTVIVYDIQENRIRNRVSKTVFMKSEHCNINLLIQMKQKIS